MKFYFSTSDLLLAVFSHLPEGKRQFHYDSGEFHTFFYEKKEKYPKLFKNIIFRTSGMFPRSEDIDTALSNLQMCSFLGSWGIDFNPYEFSKSCKSYFEKNIKPNLSRKRLKEIEEISRDFERKFSLDKILS